MLGVVWLSINIKNHGGLTNFVFLRAYNVSVRKIYTHRNYMI